MNGGPAGKITPEWIAAQRELIRAAALLGLARPKGKP